MTFARIQASTADSKRSLKYAHVESERRFLVRALPEGVVRTTRIADRYVEGTRLRLREMTADDGTVVRKLGHKVRLDGGPERVAHTSLYLDDAEWELLAALPARTLRKVRHHVVRDGIELAVDEHEDGTLVAELDGGEARPADPPAWLEVIREVTTDEAWTGGGLAR